MGRDPPPPLPGGYKLGEKVFYTWTNHTFPSGDKLVYGQQGEVVGLATGERFKGTCVAVRFPGNTTAVNCYLTTVRRRPPPPLPTPRTRPTHATLHAYALLQPCPNCKPLRRRQSWRGATANLTPLPLMNARR